MEEIKTIRLGDLEGIEILKKEIFVYMKPSGNSMTPIIKSKDKIKIGNRDWVKETFGRTDYRVGTPVYCKVKGKYYVHLIKAEKIENGKKYYQIGNNKGKINGWTSEDNIFGEVVSVNGNLLTI